MAKGKQNKNKSAAPEGESVSGYFRKVFAQKPSLLKGRSNEEVLKRWLADHPGEKEVPKGVKQGLQNVKSVLRSRSRKGHKSKAAKEASALTRSVRNASPVSQLEALEEHIDECMTLAKIIDRDKLNDVIQHLRRARNIVVWQTGE